MAKACTIRALIAELARYDPNDFVLSELWFADDIINIDETATETETRAALTSAASYFNAELGINWDTLACALSCVREKQIDTGL
ncbi:hypothetical protein AB6H26_08195 [Providencia hangzhouensis]|uniref:Uncharacterized protein n=1 Tax=Providencia rettgeri TaxID=587 RepID=A0A9N8CYE6_PRORE|nr:MULTISPECIES: hypothetical protein [Providencia]MCB4855673.1 hypothetical protein [Providencia rettgeri]MCW4539334.1 hypothetical protein [Providencia rettgeri]MDX4117386.1 hypothetical protein [Providencia rettgeri]CAB5650125.1 Uncharacterised protein [Providencia rettgeri]CAB5689347.1 Uncharacterised protein [Providencia rettgeri]